MKTYTALKDFVTNPHYHTQRQEALNRLKRNTLDAPLIPIIDGFSKLPCCFTLQSCYGHFLYNDQKNPKNIEPLPSSENITHVEYRIAYIALCLQNNDSGKILFHDLSRIPEIETEYLQFGCAGWFWKRQVNSFVLQLEPRRYMTEDRISVSYLEALYIEKLRNEFFDELEKIISKIY